MSPNTINRMLSAIKSMMTAAAEQGYISHELAETFQRVRGVKVAALKNRTRIRNRVRIEPPKTPDYRDHSRTGLNRKRALSGTCPLRRTEDHNREEALPLPLFLNGLLLEK